MNPILPLTLPQPVDSNLQKYKYITHDQLEVDWLGSASTLHQHFDGSHASSNKARYEPGTLVWVLQSKGRQHSNFNTEAACTSYMLHKKRRDKKHTRTKKKLLANGGQRSGNEDDIDVVTDNVKVENENETIIKGPTNLTHGYHSKSEMFQRARVVCDDDPLEDGVQFEKRMLRRVMVRYSRGSTYRVRAFNLVPILEESLQDKHSEEFAMPPMVIVTPETHIYRRIAKTHTTPRDSFLEIGCDYGITVDKIRKSMEDGGDVPIIWPIEADIISTNSSLHNARDNRDSCLGIDRSQESIGIASQRFPECKFTLCNILKADDMATLNKYCQQTLKHGAPSVIAIDVNGNRDVHSVLQCLQIIMNEEWLKNLRLIVVKSRFLYWDLRQMREHNTM